MNIHLLVHNIAFGLSAITSVGVIIFIITNSRRSLSNTMIIMAILGAITFIVSHILGVSVSDPILSKNILMLNMVIMFIGIFIVHSVLAYLGKTKSRWFVLWLIYIIGIFFTVLFIFNPDLFLLPSVPKMYFPNYYVPGSLNWIRLLVLDGICIPYVCLELLHSRRQTTDVQTKKQYMYLIWSLLIGNCVGFMANLLVYDIQVDPLWASTFILFWGAIFTYGSIRYGLFNIRIIAKQAFVYAFLIGIVGGFITLLDYGNSQIRSIYPGFPVWISPLISAIFIVILISLIWRRLRENEVLKYEFVTTVAHKFRTPLTHIKWASENLTSKLTAEEDKSQLNYIKSADEKLVELTSLLMNISEADNNDYDYKIEPNSISKIVEEIANNHKEQYTIKGLHVVKNVEPNLVTDFDESRIKFVVQTFTENAMHYTPENGQINISLKQTGKDIIFSVKDSGIGISNEELPRLFNKFYRGHNARLADTEGMGIGLYMSKEIISRHGGRIWAYSQGAGKGSIFSFSLKAK